MTIMKHATLLLITLVGLTGLLNAQTSATLKTQVPFAFVANGTMMPAGECVIQITVNGRTALSISSGKQHVFALPIADVSPNTRKNTALVFHQYGDRYFLTGIKHEGETGYRLPTSRRERGLQAQNVPGQVFTLLASAE